MNISYRMLCYCQVCHNYYSTAASTAIVGSSIDLYQVRGSITSRTTTVSTAARRDDDLSTYQYVYDTQADVR